MVSEAKHVFVSYVREDSDRVDELCGRLHAAQIPYWRDRESLGPGEQWKRKIRDAIRSGALVFLACFSERSRAKSKSYMNEELTLAAEEFRMLPPDAVWLIPIRFDDGDPPDWDLGAGRRLSDLNYVNLYGKSYLTEADKLVATITQLMGTDGLADAKSRKLVDKADLPDRLAIENMRSRRIAAPHTEATYQLGSDSATVRVAGLYALERVAQNDPGLRQDIVKQLCVYLRMPYTPPQEQPLAHDATESERALFETRSQELQVRQTAQRILASHLHPGGDPTQPAATFWPDTDIDLSGATLVKLDFGGCRLRAAHFADAQFIGGARFAGARFSGEARFAGVRFAGDASFTGARFASVALFTEAWFSGAGGFDGVQFTHVVGFDRAQFTGRAGFVRGRFASITGFGGAQFVGAATFFDAQFSQQPRFDHDAQHRDAPCWVRLDVPEETAQLRSWPPGWEVEPTTDRPERDGHGTWGRLVHRGW